MLLIGLCDSGKTLLFSRVSWCGGKKTWWPFAASSVTGCSVHMRLMRGLSVSAAAVRKVQEDTDLNHWQQCSLQSQKWQGESATFITTCHRPLMMIIVVLSPSWIQGSTWTLIDLPGHDSLRSQYLEKFKSAARWEQKNLYMYISFCLLIRETTRDMTDVCISVLSPTSSERLCLWWTALSSRRKWETWQSFCTPCWRTLWSPEMLQLSWWHVTNKVRSLLNIIHLSSLRTVYFDV